MPPRSPFLRDGYLIVENVLDEPAATLLREEIDRIAGAASSLPDDLRRQIIFERDLSQKQRGELTAEDVGNAVFIIGELPRFSPLLKSMIVCAPVLGIVEALFDSTEFIYHYYNATIKNPHVGSAVAWHRDFPNEYMCGSTSAMLRVMLCLDGMSPENGGLQVISDSHLLTDDEACSERSFRGRSWRDDEIVTLSCPPGAAVVLHSKIVHGSTPNRSETPRRNLISQWSGPGNHLVTMEREAYSGLMPRSTDPARRLQCEAVFDDRCDVVETLHCNVSTAIDVRQ